MANIIAIAHKELRAYFVSPIAYVLFVFFALLFGYKEGQMQQGPPYTGRGGWSFYPSG